MLPKENISAKLYLEQWMTDLCEKTDTALLLADQKPKNQQPADVPVVYQQLRTAVEADLRGENTEIKRWEVASELLDHICM